MLQCLAEIEVLNVETLIYASWTKEETTVFRVRRDTNLFQNALQIALKIKEEENKTKPTKLTSEMSKLKEEIVLKSKQVEFI